MNIVNRYLQVTGTSIFYTCILMGAGTNTIVYVPVNIHIHYTLI